MASRGERQRRPGLKKLGHRRVRTWLYMVVVVPALVVVALLVLAGSPAGNRWLRNRAADMVDGLLPGADLEVAELDTDVLRHIQLRGLRLVADDGRTLASVAGVELLWQPAALLRGEVLVNRLVIREPVVSLGVDSEGRVDLLEALGLGGEDEEEPAEPWGGSPISVRLERARIIGGRLDAAVEGEEGAATTWSVADLDLALGFELEGRDLGVDQAVLAAQVGHQVGDAEPTWLPIGLSGDLLMADTPEAYPLQDLLLEDLRLQLGSAVAGAGGQVAGLGGEPRLDVQLALRDLVPEELAFLTGDLGIAGPFALEADVSGPPEALELQAALRCPDDAGTLRIGLGANVAAPQLAWKLQARLDSIEPHRFVEALPEPFMLHGGLTGQGGGTTWPDGLVAELGLALEPGVAWGVGLGGLSAKATLEDGLVHFEQLAFASELGRGSLQGHFDPAASTLEAGFRLDNVPLWRLATFGVSDLEGLAAAAGTAVVVLGESGTDARVSGQADISGAGYGGLASASSLTSPLSLRWAEGALGVEGVMSARGVESSGALVSGAHGPWRFDLEPDGSMAWQAELAAAGITYGVVQVAEARAAVGGGIPADAPLELEVGFDASGLAAPSSITPDLRADRAAGRLELVGDDLRLVAQAKEGERQVLTAELGMDLASGGLELPALLIAPTSETTWHAVEPIQATLVDGGLRGLRLQLRSGDALLWGMGDFDPSGPVDLRLMVSDFTLDPLVPLFPGLPRGLQGVTRLALQVHGSAEAIALAGSAEIEDLVVPGSVRDMDARLVLDGDGRRLGFQLDIPEPVVQQVSWEEQLARVDGGESDVVEVEAGPSWSSASMLHASGSVPLAVSVEGVALEPDAPWELELLLAPGEIERFGERLELPDLQPARASAHAEVGGTPAAATVTLTGAAELPLGDEGQRVRVDLDLAEADGLAELEVVVAQHMLRQAELTGSAQTGLTQVIREQTGALFGAPAEGELLDLADLRTWVGEIDASLVPLGISTEVLARVAPIPDAVSGSLVGGLRIEGDPMRPGISGALQLVDAQLGDVGMAPALVTLAPADGGYDLGATLGFDGGGSLLVSGFAPLQLDFEDSTVLERSLEADGLDLSIGGGGVPLAALVAFAADAEDVRGTLELGGHVGGSIMDPDSDLSVRLEEGSMVLSDLGIRYDSIGLQAGVDGRLAQLDELFIRSSPAYGFASSGVGKGASRLAERVGVEEFSGTLELTGSAILDHWVPDAVDISGVAENFWAIDTSAYRLAFSGDFDASGRWPELEIGGDIAVDEGRFVLDESLFLYAGTLDLDPRLQIHRGFDQARVEEEPGPPFYQDMVVDLQLDLSRAATVKVEMPFDDSLGAVWASALTIVIETRVDGILDVGFSDGQPTVLGEVEPVWGRADILGKRFALGEGLISFVGDDPFDPILQLEAVHDAGQWGEVAVDISGSLAELGLAFRSEDYPDETDIVAILLMGAPMSELSSEESDPYAQLFAAAVGALRNELERQGGGGQIVEMVELGEGSAKLGGSLGDDIFVTLERKSASSVEKGENITEVTLDWTISRSWSAEVVTGDQGTSSADLFWTWRF